MDVHRALIDIDVVSPHGIEKMLAAENAPRASHEKFQQAKLRRAELQLLAVASCAMGFPVELHIARREKGRDMGGLGAAQKRANAGEKLRHRERLDD